LVVIEVITFTYGLIYKLYDETKKRIRMQQDFKLQSETISMLNATQTQLNLNLLQTQLNPHFIFNALNSVKYHILLKENDKASLYLSQFASLMRMVLDYGALQSISLKRELDLLRLYIELESLRYEDRFEYSIEVSDNTEPEFIKVPPLILQPLVENVFVHAFDDGQSECKLKITVTDHGNEVEICIIDNGKGINYTNAHISHTHHSKAIKMISDRLDQWGELNDIDTKISIENLYENRISKGTKITVVL
jgi:LytS/YehU family sensor histidine kinase